MKIRMTRTKPPRVEMLPLIDVVFLLLVVFIYTMLSMAVHKGMPVLLPGSSQAQPVKEDAAVLTVTVQADGRVFLDQQAMAPAQFLEALDRYRQSNPQTGVLLFADRQLPYQRLFEVLDQIRQAGLTRVSLQAEPE